MSRGKTHNRCQKIVAKAPNPTEQSVVTGRKVAACLLSDWSNGIRPHFAFTQLKFLVNAARQTCITITWLGVRSDLATGTGNALGILRDSVLAPRDTERYKEGVWDFTLMGSRLPLLDHCSTSAMRRTST